MKLIYISILSLCVVGCASIPADSKNEYMVASWYQSGKKTANGEKFIPDGMTAAHRTLPFGTRLRLRHKDKTVNVRINDRGPFIKGRHIDLSRGAARALGCLGNCTLRAEIVQ